jgi:PIN domain nuclease of toxin-antitoxin system
MILDTCALLWLVGQRENLSDSALTAIESSSDIAVSSITALEIGQKFKRGLLKLPMAPLPWFERAMHIHRLTPLDLTPAVCLRATELPEIHKDPFDRLIIAAALLSNRTVVTKDTVFERYGVQTLT